MPLSFTTYLDTIFIPLPIIAVVAGKPCPSCRQPFSDGTGSQRSMQGTRAYGPVDLKCGHILCRDCASRYVEEHNVCGLCETLLYTRSNGLDSSGPLDNSPLKRDRKTLVSRLRMTAATKVEPVQAPSSHLAIPAVQYKIPRKPFPLQTSALTVTAASTKSSLAPMLPTPKEYEIGPFKMLINCQVVEFGKIEKRDVPLCDLCGKRCLPNPNAACPVQTKCHAFCGSCVAAWLVGAKKCPMRGCGRVLIDAELSLYTVMMRKWAVDRVESELLPFTEEIVLRPGTAPIDPRDVTVAIKLFADALRTAHTFSEELSGKSGHVDLQWVGAYLVALQRFLPLFRAYMDDEFTDTQQDQWVWIIPTLFLIFKRQAEEGSVDFDAKYMLDHLNINVQRVITQDLEKSRWMSKPGEEPSPGQKDLNMVYRILVQVCIGSWEVRNMPVETLPAKPVVDRGVLDRFFRRFEKI